MPSSDVLDVLGASAASRADTALVECDTGRTLSYAALSDLVDQRATALDGRGVCPVVLSPDGDGVVSLLAVWRAGRVAAPIHASLTDEERGAALDALEGVRPPAGAQAVLWTSGSSGSPRGLVLGADALRHVTQASVVRLGVGGDDVWGLTLSPAHVGGLASVVRAILLGGAIVVPADRSAAALDRMLGEGEVRPTRLSLVPTQLRRLLDRRAIDERGAPEGLKSVLVGGAHAPPDLVRRGLTAGWPLALTYGATETTSQMATATPDETRSDPTHVGRPLPGVEVRIGSGGEIEARGPTVALGRIGLGGIESVAALDGWYRTGDFGSVDDDGFLRVTGRRVDRIVTGGVTVEAVEVEDVLRSIPGIVDACVVGVPDVEWGERVAAWVEIDPSGPGLSASQLDDAVRDRLSSAKRPRDWHLGGPLPRNVNGKVDRGAVRRAYETGHR